MKIFQDTALCGRHPIRNIYKKETFMKFAINEFRYGEKKYILIELLLILLMFHGIDIGSECIWDKILNK